MNSNSRDSTGLRSTSLFEDFKIGIDMADYNYEQWDRVIGDLAFEDVFASSDQRTAAKPQKPKDGTVAGADEMANEHMGDRAKTIASSSMAGKTGAATDLRKIILSLENARLL